MTTISFPVTGAINHDAVIIRNAMRTRSEQIKSNANAQNICKKITIVAIKILGLAAGVVAVATVPAAIFLFSATPLTIGAFCLVACISLLALHTLLDPCTPKGESIVKSHWDRLFDALKEGNGQKIIDSCKDLFKQKESRKTSFNQCLGTLPADEVNPFLHKSCFVGHLQIALEHLRKNEDDQAKSRAHIALSHFDASGFPTHIKDFAAEITENPQRIRTYIEKHNAGNDLYALDIYLS